MKNAPPNFIPMTHFSVINSLSLANHSNYISL